MNKLVAIAIVAIAASIFYVNSRDTSPDLSGTVAVNSGDRPSQSSARGAADTGEQKSQRSKQSPPKTSAQPPAGSPEPEQDSRPADSQHSADQSTPTEANESSEQFKTEHPPPEPEIKTDGDDSLANVIDYEVKDDTSHGEFAAKYQSYSSIGQNEKLSKALLGSFVGEITGRADAHYALEMSVDGVIENSEFVGTSTIALDHNDRRVARLESNGDLSDFKVNDRGELVFTDIGGLETDTATPYYIFKVSFNDASSSYFTISRFDGTAVKNIGRGILQKR